MLQIVRHRQVIDRLLKPIAQEFYMIQQLHRGRHLSDSHYTQYRGPSLELEAWP